MTSTTDRRLQRVEAALYPTEAMALWLQEAKQEYQSMGDLVRSLKHQPSDAWPLFKLTAQAEAAAKDRLKGQASIIAGGLHQRASLLDRGQRDAARDVATLWYLFLNVNARFMAEKRALWALLALHHASMALLCSVHRDWFRAGGNSPDQRVTTTLIELFMWDGIVRTLAERYYHGQSPLLAEAQENLDGLVEHGERLAEMFNEHVELEIELQKGSRKRKPKLPEPIDLDAVKRAAQPSVDAHVRLMVDMARAEAYEMMGEHKRALAFAERHL